MQNQDFTASFLVDQAPEEVFNAVNNVRGWWSEEIEGSTDKLNAEWSYHYEDLHRCKMKITALIPGKKVEWLVTDNFFSFTKDKKEWIGTKIIFEISKKGNQTQLVFTHQGLIPEYECYSVCFDAWTGYIKKSLYNLVATGEGNPNKGEEITSHQKRN
jgi:hypothetical protein